MQIPLKTLLVCLAGICLLAVGVMFVREGQWPKGIASMLVAVANVLFLLA